MLYRFGMHMSSICLHTCASIHNCIYIPSIQSSEFSSFQASENSPSLSATEDNPGIRCVKVNSSFCHFCSPHFCAMILIALFNIQSRDTYKQKIKFNVCVTMHQVRSISPNNRLSIVAQIFEKLEITYAF